MLYSLSSKVCTIAVHGQQHTTLKRHNVVTSITPPIEIIPSGSSTSITDPSPLSSSGWTTWSTIPSDVDVVHDPASSINPSSSTSDPWAIDSQDSIDTGVKELPGSGPLPWLMTKEFSSNFLNVHIVLKVLPNFMGGRLSKRFVSTACPDPFCGENGPSPEGCVKAFCTSNSAGAAIKHYHIPARDLSPAPPHKKNQHVLILDGNYCGLIQTVASCYTKDSTVKIAIEPTVTIKLCFNQDSSYNT
ncbi:uncharacterized protein HD556DRAFT_1446733 [Suillus plorans]|uniref:Uncharacterized protein n=1 Tax=Suillus plorans TaxID=116603 RepID=A0A9P7AHW6_9AGAM|nr:uncharacterized protein HD556DRAFT_1451943 [Suillus plorans]XP_041156747.1 uncharacterized protein HD556DRAFT_1446733 [Suillus plorans]KAG1784299.1 hypothetical protein HD556DRAFT_1451943 [Suillus plorans]KAG1789717.1 hypothetical protein HD556DRAFT_1446733 [Suillus plorans]